ncbi:DUF1549 domain-containing protein, partial [Methylobacter sp.]|uniref:DUF1549 domain-containing protein n=1 Tax=Methylobacter sp. TaxID=2051955 RepID=UPI003DA605E8
MRKKLYPAVLWSLAAAMTSDAMAVDEQPTGANVGAPQAAQAAPAPQAAEITPVAPVPPAAEITPIAPAPQVAATAPATSSAEAAPVAQATPVPQAAAATPVASATSSAEAAPVAQAAQAPQTAQATQTAQDTSSKSKLWSYQPVKAPVIPAVKQQAWVRTPIDAFVLQKLEEKGVQPSADADRAAFIRRATLDVWGVIPTPEEVNAFVNDTSDNAHEKLVDRLLASPKYGE